MDLQPSLLQRTHLGDYRTTATRIDQDFVDSPLARRLPPTGYVTIFCSSQDYHCPKNYTDELSDINKYYRGVLEHTQTNLMSAYHSKTHSLETDLTTEHRLASGYKNLHDDLLIKLRLLSDQNSHLERDLKHSQQQIMHLRTHLQQAESELSGLRSSLSNNSSELNHLRSFNVALDHADNRLRSEFDVSVLEHRRRMNELLERCNTLQATKDRDDAEWGIKVRDFEKVGWGLIHRSSEISGNRSTKRTGSWLSFLISKLNSRG